jgi:hypothetical protein
MYCWLPNAMSELSLVERAQLGQVDAIASLMNASLRCLGIQVRATLQDNRLHVLLEAAQSPAQRPCIEFIQQGLAQLQRVQAGSAVVYGRILGQTVPSWVQQIELTRARAGSPERPAASPSILQTATIQIPEWQEFPDSELIEIPAESRAEIPALDEAPQTIIPIAIPAIARAATPTSQLVHRPRTIRRRSKAQRWYGSILKTILTNDRLFIALLLGLPLLLVLLGGYALNRFGLGAAAKPAASSTAQIAPIAPPDSFESALQQASVAVELSHACKTTADWQAVAKEWRGAIAQMQAVPQTHPNAAIAQIKLQEYQQTLTQITERHLGSTTP